MPEGSKYSFVNAIIDLVMPDLVFMDIPSHQRWHFSYGDSIVEGRRAKGEAAYPAPSPMSIPSPTPSTPSQYARRVPLFPCRCWQNFHRCRVVDHTPWTSSFSHPSSQPLPIAHCPAQSQIMAFAATQHRKSPLPKSTCLHQDSQ